jgi:peptidyl-prolyl cis-trans isomerase-like 4
MIKYYNYSPIYNVQPNFSFQSGDPIGPNSKDSDGGCSIWALPDGTTKRASKPQNVAFIPEISGKRKHTERGTLSMATTVSKTNPDQRFASSQFIITLGENLDQLDEKAAIFGQVVEGFDALEKINTTFVDQSGRPLQDIRILHTVVLDDPYSNPTGLVEPPGSPVPSAEQLATVRIAHDEVLAENNDPEKLEQIRREREARAQALTLELIGDLPFADVTPPEQILFVCKLNPVTQDEDLELIFSRFGKILSCEVIRDKKTGDSLQYAFIEFATKEDCERAYFKMQGVLIDDHRIHVDFSQSVSKISAEWRSNTKSKTAGYRGGFGGIDSLEKRQQYRDSGSDRDRRRDYDYVFDKDRKDKSRGDDARHTDRGSDSKRQRSRSRSPKRRSDRPSDDRRDYRRSDDRRDDRRSDNYRRDDRHRPSDRERQHRDSRDNYRRH